MTKHVIQVAVKKEKFDDAQKAIIEAGETVSDVCRAAIADKATALGVPMTADDLLTLPWGTWRKGKGEKKEPKGFHIPEPIDETEE